MYKKPISNGWYSPHTHTHTHHYRESQFRKLSIDNFMSGDTPAIRDENETERSI